MKKSRSGRIAAALAAVWMCLYSLAVPASAAAIGKTVTPEDGESISAHVEGDVDGWESDDGYFDTIDEDGTSTDHRGRGLLISDVTAGTGGDVSVTFTGGMDVTTTGKEGGIGAHVFSIDRQVSAKIEGQPIRMTDISDNGRNAAGIMAHVRAGGKVNLISRADVEAVSRSEGKGLPAGKLTHIYGIYLRNATSAKTNNYYIDDSGRKIPVALSDSTRGTVPGVIMTDPSNYFTDEEEQDLYAAEASHSERQGDIVISTYDFFLCKSDGTLVAWSEGNSAEAYSRYNPNTVSGGEAEGEPIEITVHTYGIRPTKK